MIDLHIKYRPKRVGQLVGNDAVVHVLKKYLDNGHWPHAFLITGEAGSGKTTTARLIAKYTKCSGQGIVEQDAGVLSGVDSIRELVARVTFPSLSKTGNVCIILDECHAISKQGWNALLKTLEEPPRHGLFYTLHD